MEVYCHIELIEADTFSWIFVRAELQVVIFSIFFTYCKHCLKRILSRSKQKAVIAVSGDAKEDALDPATAATLSEDIEEAVHVKTVQKS